MSPEDVRLERHIRKKALSRPHDNPWFPPFTPEELEQVRRIRAGRPWPRGPVAMLPVAQLYLRDFPLLASPGRADVLQVLWCPFDHEGEETFPRTALFWRSSGEITSVLTSPPEPAGAQVEGYVPEPCVLHPEQVTEYPLELSEDLQEQVGRWSARRAGCDTPDRFDAIDYAFDPEGLYASALSAAPGWKVGGWPRWGRNDPEPQFCPSCDSEMVPLLTIASTEWDADTRSWIPCEDQARTEPSSSCLDPGDPAMIQIGDNDNLQLYICPASPDHPHNARQQ